MEEYQKRDSSSDEERQTIDDNDMEDSPTDTTELWMPDRNDEDTKFVRAKGDAIPTKKYPQVASEVCDCSGEEKAFQRYAQGVRGGMETQTSSVADEYLRDVVCEAIWNRNTVTFPMTSSDTASTSGWQLPIPMYTYVYVVCIYIYIQISYMHIYVYIFTHVNFLTKSKRMRKEKNRP
jgi:hypothetical protein